ncbi:fructosamine kinase family protein [Gramella lutea]|uniref:Fructosamine kinase family protein n=1 Tax=Christiangramia lutea TaxID=1607951 RepID=A0A9X1V0Y7_9FLAO|nr:fructosamine kinase family protein [Christiangramia lutea]MCH4821855.1 fructosamine kinase family protein [Christiangramia lutea]
MIESNLSNVLHRIAEEFEIELSNASTLTGGDINEVFLLEGKAGKFVVKLNDAEQYPGMFEAEKSGLEELRAPGVIDVPSPMKTGQVDSYSYLILEHKPSAPKRPDFWEIFGEQLAHLHKQRAGSFGFETNNYIGSLPQYNDHRDSASRFYLEMRLEPQIRMAEEKGFQLNVSNTFYENCQQMIPDEPPALIHGDLWNGNFLVNSDGRPCLIDPAVAYAPREMDLGMMKLFGGFHEDLFKIYDQTFPLEAGWKDRVDLWQLYYLLVHLNIFGAGYRSKVLSIINKYG